MGGVINWGDFQDSISRGWGVQTVWDPQRRENLHADACVSGALHRRAGQPVRLAPAGHEAVGV